jgi:uncharacterized protein HemX
MLRTCVLYCAMAGVLGLAVGCSFFSDTKDTKSSLSQRDEAVKTMKAKLEEMDKKIDELKAKAEKATGEEKTKLEAKWKESAGKREEFAKKYEQLKAAAADKWEAAKNETEHAFDELKKAIEK